MKRVIGGCWFEEDGRWGGDGVMVLGASAGAAASANCEALCLSLQCPLVQPDQSWMLQEE